MNIKVAAFTVSEKSINRVVKARVINNIIIFLLFFRAKFTSVIKMTEEMMYNVTKLPVGDPVDTGSEHHFKMAVIGILSFFTVLGSVGNSMVLYVYVRKRNKLASTIFIITLAGTDLMTCVVIIPYTMAVNYLDYYLKYDIFCKSYMFLITSNVPFSAFIMVAIAVDRYLCICHPFTHLLNAKRAKCVIFILAMTAITLGVITALSFGIFRYEPPASSGNADGYTYQENNYTVIASIGYNLTKFTGAYNATLISHSLDSSVDVDPVDYVALEINGQCLPYSSIFSEKFVNLYQKIYSSFFVIVIVTVIVLYVMIYRFVSVRRAKRQRMRSQRSGYASCRETSYAETKVSYSNGCTKTEVSETFPKSEAVRQQTIREKGLVANVRTAGMLFVVTAVFIIVFLPAWLMAHKVIPYNSVIFYLYFFYNVANPIVYAFMNKSFRRNLKDVFECRPIY